MEVSSGLQLHSTVRIQNFLARAGLSSALNADLLDLAMRYKDQDTVPYRVLKNIWLNMESEEQPCLRELLAGVSFALQNPKPREKSEELKERLKKLQEMIDAKAYKELIKDVSIDKDAVVPFSTYKDQLGFGLHVIVTMFTGFLLGYALFRALFQDNPVLYAAGGILGLVAGMLLETTLFMIRTYQYDNATKMKKTLRYSHKKKRQ